MQFMNLFTNMMVNKAFIKIKLIGVFLNWCWKYPLDIKENFQDIKSRYFFETDIEMLELLKSLEKMNDK